MNSRWTFHVHKRGFGVLYVVGPVGVPGKRGTWFASKMSRLKHLNIAKMILSSVNVWTGEMKPKIREKVFATLLDNSGNLLIQLGDPQIQVVLRKWRDKMRNYFWGSFAFAWNMCASLLLFGRYFELLWGFVVVSGSFNCSLVAGTGLLLIWCWLVYQL